MITHLKKNKTTYWKHWRRAMKLSGALFIHAWLPDLFSDYATLELYNE